jgi:hypothetical protein
VRGVKKENKFFPVGFQRAFPFSDNTVIRQFQDIHKFAAKKE